MTAKAPGMDAFFNYARMRHQCYIMKNADPLWLTKDPILAEYSFCNVFRELDRTTKWLADNVRGPMDKRKDPNLMLAVVLFRMFNRIETAEAMFRDDNLLGDHSAFDNYVRTGRVSHLRKAVITRLGVEGPHVTGSYIIAGPPGYTKLDGMLKVVDDFRRGSALLDLLESDPKAAVMRMTTKQFSLQQTHEWFRQFPFFGVFHSYEIVTDLRWTHLLRRAPDIKTWCNPGPGCMRGLNRVFGRDKDARPWSSRLELLLEMDEILSASSMQKHWTRFAMQQRDDYPKLKTPLEWEMRDVEHTLCEFDKYERTRTGEGRPRGKYKGRASAG